MKYTKKELQESLLDFEEFVKMTESTVTPKRLIIARDLIKKELDKDEIIDIKDQKILLQIKSLLNHLDYIIKEEHKNIVNLYHKFCRKYCSLK